VRPAPVLRRVAVVGAGMAGLACARALADAGIAVVCIDKSRGPSGRLATRRADGWQFDHGAQYFTARDPGFRAQVHEWLQAGVAARWAPRLVAFDHASGPPRATGSMAPDGSLAGGAHAEPQSDPRSEPRSDPRSHPEPVPATAAPDRALDRFVGTPTMTAPARHLAQGLDVRYGCTVHALHPDSQGWRLQAADDGSPAPEGVFDAIVLALPAPQALPLLAAPADAAGLAELAAVARESRMRSCWALMLRCAAPLGLPFDAAFVNDGPLRWVARDSGKPGRHRDDGGEAWVLHASAAWSEANLEREPAQVLADLLAAFAALGAPVVRADSPMASPAQGIAATAHRWRYADTDPALDRRFAWDAAHRIGLCGDWLNGGRVEGAWLSGRALAAAILDADPRPPAL
jgi:renalase